MVKVKEVEIVVKDMRGKELRKYWHIVENPIWSIPEVFPKRTGRWRYREIEFKDNEDEVKIFP